MALEAAERAGAEQHPALAAEALLHAGWLQAYRGLDVEAAALLTRSVATGRSCGATALEAEALSRLGYVHIGLADRIKARACIEQACTLALQHPADLDLQRLVVANLAEIERLEDHPEIARPLYELSLRHGRSKGDRLATMIALNNLAMCAVAAEQAQQAHATLVESLTICDELGSRRGRLVVMEVCAASAAELEQWAQAARFSGAAEFHTTLMGRRRDVVDIAFLAPRLALARAALGDAGYAQLMADGAVLSYEQSVLEMRVWLEVPASDRRPGARQAPSLKESVAPVDREFRRPFSLPYPPGTAPDTD